jgi:hypothetical protein
MTESAQPVMTESAQPLMTESAQTPAAIRRLPEHRRRVSERPRRLAFNAGSDRCAASSG